MGRFAIVHNPLSYRGRKVARVVRRMLGDSPDHAWIPLVDLEKANPAPNTERVVCIGGDGTINAVAGWLDRHASTRPVGIVPAGTGNNLARGLGLPLDIEDSARIAFESSRTSPLDVIRYTTPTEDGSRLVVQTSSLGFSARIAGQYDRLRKHRVFRWVARPFGTYVYRLLALAGLVAQKRSERRGDPPIRVKIRAGDETLEEDVFAIFIGNERSLGGNFYPCPLAKMDDGLIDICLVRAGTGERYLKVFGHIAKGKQLELEKTIVYWQTSGPIEIELSEKLPYLADGDLWVTSDRYRLEVLPGHFEVAVRPDEPTSSPSSTARASSAPPPPPR